MYELIELFYEFIIKIMSGCLTAVTLFLLIALAVGIVVTTPLWIVPYLILRPGGDL